MKTNELLKVGLIIDAITISGITKNNKLLSPQEVIDIWDETGILYYDSQKGNVPIVVGDKSSVNPIEVHLLKGDLT